ncbi:hypothetical protein D3C75_221090 [compost metagenome]
MAERIIVVPGTVAKRIGLFDLVARRIVAVPCLRAERVGHAEQLVAFAIGIGGHIAFAVCLGEHVAVRVVGVGSLLSLRISNFLELSHIVVLVRGYSPGFIPGFGNVAKRVIGAASAVIQRVLCAGQAVDLIGMSGLHSGFIRLLLQIAIGIIDGAAGLAQSIGDGHGAVLRVILDLLKLAFRVGNLHRPVQRIAVNDRRVAARVLDLAGESCRIIGVCRDMAFGIGYGDRNSFIVSCNGHCVAQGIRAAGQIAGGVVFIGAAIAPFIHLYDRTVQRIIVGKRGVPVPIGALDHIAPLVIRLLALVAVTVCNADEAVAVVIAVFDG